MAMLTDDMKKMIETQQCFIATVDPAGIPNIGPKRSTRVLDDNTLVFNEATGKHTYNNIRVNPKVAVAVVNRDILDGYRFVGTATIHESDELYNKAAENAVKAGFPKPKAVITVDVEEVYSLKPATAGKRIV
ncbi:MAG: pyridoxamine 5'-phosphate oxidase family protein [Syntrophothermus sp.]